MKTQIITDASGRIVKTHQYGWVTHNLFVSKLREFEIEKILKQKNTCYPGQFDKAQTIQFVLSVDNNQIGDLYLNQNDMNLNSFDADCLVAQSIGNYILLNLTSRQGNNYER